MKNLWNSHKRRLSRQTAVHPKDLSGDKIPALSSLGAPITQEARKRARGIVQAEIDKCPSLLQPSKSKGREGRSERRAFNSSHGVAAAQRSVAQAHAHATAQARAQAIALAHHNSRLAASQQHSQQALSAQSHIAQVSAALVAAASRGMHHPHSVPVMHSSTIPFTSSVKPAPITSAGTFSQPARPPAASAPPPTAFLLQSGVPGGSASGIPEAFSDHEEDDLPSPTSPHHASHLPFHPTPTLDTAAVSSRQAERQTDTGGDVPFLKLPSFAEMLDDETILVPHGPPARKVPRMSPAEEVLPQSGRAAASVHSGSRSRVESVSTHDIDDTHSSISGSGRERSDSMAARMDSLLPDGTAGGDHVQRDCWTPGEGQSGPPLTAEALSKVFHAQVRDATSDNERIQRFDVHTQVAAALACGPGEIQLFPPFVAESPPQLLHNAPQLGAIYAAAYTAGFKAGTAATQTSDDGFDLGQGFSPADGSVACGMLAAAQLSRHGWSQDCISEHLEQAQQLNSYGAGLPGLSLKKSVSPHSSLAGSAVSPSHSSDTPAARRGSASGAPSESPRPFSGAIDDKEPDGGREVHRWTSPRQKQTIPSLSQWAAAGGFVVPGINMHRPALSSVPSTSAPAAPLTGSPSEAFVSSIFAASRTHDNNGFTPPSSCIPPELNAGMAGPDSPGQSGNSALKSSALTRSPGTMFLNSPVNLAKATPPTNEDFGFLPSPAKDSQK